MYSHLVQGRVTYPHPRRDALVALLVGLRSHRLRIRHRRTMRRRNRRR